MGLSRFNGGRALSHMYDKLKETSIKLVSMSLFVIAISIFAIHLVELYYMLLELVSGKSLHPELAKEIIIAESVYALKIILIANVSKIIERDAHRGVEELHNGIRELVLLIAVYLLIVIFLGRVLESRIDLYGVAAPEAFYTSLIAVLLVAHFMKKADAKSIGGRVLHAIGYMMETTVIIVLIINIMHSGLPYIEHSSLMFLIPSAELIKVITTYAILSTLLIGLEIVSLKMTSTISVFGALIHIIRKTTMVALGIVVGLVLVIFAFGFAPGLVKLFIGFADIMSTFVLLLFIFTWMFAIGLIVGIIAGILYLVSGLRSRSLISLSIAIKELGEKTVPKPESKMEVSAEKRQEPQRTSSEERTVEEKMKCPFCGAEISRPAKFCSNCGAYLQEEEGTRVYSTK